MEAVERLWRSARGSRTVQLQGANHSRSTHTRGFRHFFAIGVAIAVTAGFSSGHAAEGDPARGRKHFQACVACHSVRPGEHLTGPSLHGIFGKKAATAPGFQRYSPALKASDVVWNAETLNAWLADPARHIPNNWMVFPGVKDPAARADLIAFLKTTDAGPTSEKTAPRKPNLKQAKADSVVKSIGYCGDAYTVHTAAGREAVIWEFNLRFKTDSSASGPAKGQPVLLPAGMQGDRASVIFSDPAEISAFIRRTC